MDFYDGACALNCIDIFSCLIGCYYSYNDQVSPTCFPPINKCPVYDPYYGPMYGNSIVISMYWNLIVLCIIVVVTFQ